MWTFTHHFEEDELKTLVYLSGPYSGRIDANIKSARKIAVELWEKGYAVICPHLNTAHFERDCEAEYEDYISGDLLMVERCDAIVMLPGWQRSAGAKIERAHAESKGFPVYIYPELPPLQINRQSILEEAENIVNGARRSDYGTPLENHSVTAVLWAAYLGQPISAEQVCMMNILQKVSRSKKKITRDTLVDIAGYAENLDQVQHGKRE